MMIPEGFDTTVDTLGSATIVSPLTRSDRVTHARTFVQNSRRVVIELDPRRLQAIIASGREIPSFEMAGPRHEIFFEPEKLNCALVTCGGLCPGLNDIIRSVVLELYYGYGVRKIHGIRYGLQGFIERYGHDIMELTPENVTEILEMGGSILGSSRGPQSVAGIVDFLERREIGLLFMIGGDGTLTAASLIQAEITSRDLSVSVVGIPKTIDNDIFMVSRSFGFDSAVSVATEAITSAHNESRGYPNGIGLIKLMGRHSGFIAATATLAQQNVNFVLIPEIDFDLEGPRGFLKALEDRLQARKHAVIVVAEGAGQKFFDTSNAQRDPSGNIKLGDIGLFLKEKILSYLQEKQMECSLKYIDPSYIIRSLPACARDHVFCSFLGRDAVHAGMAGKTNLLVGYWNEEFVHIPLTLPVGRRKQVDPGGTLWQNVIQATGQAVMVNN
jgi:6-phosphofructokinase 1